MVEDLNREPENSGEGSGEDEPVFKMTEYKIDRNNTKSFEYCEVFSNCTIGQVSSLRLMSSRNKSGRKKWSNVVKKL